MSYPKVNRAHVVPRFLLKRFAVDELITVHSLGDGEERTVSIDDAAIRKRFYRRARPDGSTIDDVEYSLAQLETVIAPTLGGVEDSWPLERETKCELAEFIAFQAVRSPRWRQWHQEFTRQAMADRRRDPHHQMESGLWLPLSQHDINKVESHLLSDTQRLKRMMDLANKLITVFASMRWDLLCFDEDCLIVSDHPLVEWPLEAERLSPGQVPGGNGLVNTLEVRLPISSKSAILMTWQDTGDGPAALRADQAQAANLNAFSVAQAEKAWMYRPGSTPPIGEGPLGSLARALLPSYNRSTAEASAIRARVTDSLNGRLGQDGQGQAEVISVSGRAAQREPGCA